MFDLASKKRGPGRRGRFTAQDYGRIQRALSAIQPSLLSATPGVTQRVTPQGTSIDVDDPKIPRWVFVTEVSGGRVRARFANRGDDKWGTLFASVSGYPAPNYTTEHFEKFVVDDPDDIKETDRACLWMGGFFVPDFRMLLVDPAPPEELCDDG